MPYFELSNQNALQSSAIHEYLAELTIGKY